MALRLSTGFRNGLLGASGVCDLLNGGKINIYSGGQPASADYAETGVLLATITTGASGSGLVLGTAAAGVISKSASTWSGTCAVAGIAGWARFYGTAGTTGSSATEVRLDGNVGISGSDFVLANTSLTLGATQTIDTFTLTEPAS